MPSAIKYWEKLTPRQIIIDYITKVVENIIEREDIVDELLDKFARNDDVRSASRNNNKNCKYASIVDLLKQLGNLGISNAKYYLRDILSLLKTGALVGGGLWLISKLLEYIYKKGNVVPWIKKEKPYAAPNVQRVHPGDTTIKWTGQYSDIPQQYAIPEYMQEGDPTLSPQYKTIANEYARELEQMFPPLGTGVNNIASTTDLIQEILKSSGEPGKHYGYSYADTKRGRRVRRITKAQMMQQPTGVSYGGMADDVSQYVRQFVSPRSLESLISNVPIEKPYPSAPFVSGEPSRFTEPVEYLPAGTPRLTQLALERAYRAGGLMDAYEASVLEWHIRNNIIEKLKRDIITPETARKVLSFLINSIYYKYPADQARRIINYVISNVGDINSMIEALEKEQSQDILSKDYMSYISPSQMDYYINLPSAAMSGYSALQ